MIQTYSLAEVAAMVLPPEWTDAARWLARRLNRGEISGYKVGRVWRMTDEDVAALIARHRSASPPEATVVTKPPCPAATSLIDGLSQRSRRRLNRLG